MDNADYICKWNYDGQMLKCQQVKWYMRHLQLDDGYTIEHVSLVMITPTSVDE